MDLHRVGILLLKKPQFHQSDWAHGYLYVNRKNDEKWEFLFVSQQIARDCAGYFLGCWQDAWKDSCGNEQRLHACCPQCMSVDSWPFGMAFHKMEMHLPVHGTPSFWPSFLQEDSILPERTPAVAVIGVFIAQLGHAFSAMQLKQAFQRPTLSPKCLYSPC